MTDGVGAVALGLLFGVGFVASSLLWHLYVRPQVVLAWFRGAETPAQPDPTTLRALRFTMSVLVFLLGAVAGGATLVWMGR